jgi:microsomal dipeptidase-like Zn-dependent dipeptidase
MKRFLKVVAGLIVIAIIGFFTFAPSYVGAQRNPIRPHAPYPISAAAQTLHDSLIIGDWHADSLLWKRNLLTAGQHGHVDVPRLLDGNVALQMFTAVTKSPAGHNIQHNATDARDNITLLAIGQLWPPRTWNSLLERALYQAEKLHAFAEKSDQLRIIKTRADLERLLDDRAAGQQVIGGLLGIEGAHPLEGDIANLDTLVDAGHRMIALQHFFDNAVGGSLHGQSNAGLTDFGKQVVTEVANRDLILDVAHSSPHVVRDVLAITDIPIVVSHTGVHSVCPVKRNFTDDLMQDIAATGGVIAIGYWRTVLCDDSPAGIAHSIKAAIDLVGDDHVSLGSDFDGSVTTSLDVSEIAAVTQALLDLNLTEAQIRKVMGENMLRVLRERLPK